MNPTRRKKQHRYRLSRPEDLGLVPLKYLKRKTPPTTHAIGTPPSTPPSSSSPRGVVRSPSPRILGPHMDETARLSSVDPQLAKAAFIQLLIQKGLRIPRSDFVEDWKSTMLRAERYDSVKAVERCRRHWAIKSDWFGTPDLKAVIRDLAPNLVQKGCIQVVPVRDSNGRVVICLHFQPKLYSSQEREVRTNERRGKITMLYPGLPNKFHRSKSTFSICWRVYWKISKPRTRGFLLLFGILKT